MNVDSGANTTLDQCHIVNQPLVADADASDCVALKQAQLYKDFFYRHKEEDSSNPK